MLQYLSLIHAVSKGPEPYVQSDRCEQEASSSPLKSTKPIHTLAAAESDVKAAKEEIKALKSQLKDVKRTGTPAQRTYFSQIVLQCSNNVTLVTEPAPVVRPHKGASLANPNKKARKYQAIEFESDDE